MFRQTLALIRCLSLIIKLKLQLLLAQTVYPVIIYFFLTECPYGDKKSCQKLFDEFGFYACNTNEKDCCGTCSTLKNDSNPG